MTTDASAAVRAAMQSLAASGHAFDAARVATLVELDAATVATLLDEHFWNGAIAAFGYRRQARTGLPPLFSRFAGDAPGVLAEGPPPDPRAPADMPTAWIVEAPGVLFREGFRMTLDVAEYGAVMAEPDTTVSVTWKRSPGGRFNVVDAVTRRDRRAPRPSACLSLAQVVHVDPALRGLTARGEGGDLVLPLEGAAPPGLGEVVRVVWERAGAAYQARRFERLDLRVSRWFVPRWLEALRAHVPHVPDHDALLASGDEGLEELTSPLDLVDATPGSIDVYLLLVAIDAARDEDEPRWIFHYDHKEPPVEDVLARLGLPADARLPRVTDDGPDAWAASVSTLAETRGLRERVFPVEGNGDDRLVVVLPPEAWYALVASGVLLPAEQSRIERRPTTLEEARTALSPRWDDDEPFADVAALDTFLASPFGQLVPMDVPHFHRIAGSGEADGYVHVLEPGLGPWVTVSTTVAEEWDRETVLAIEAAIAPPVVMSMTEEALYLQIGMPLESISPRRLLAVMRTLHDAAKEARDAVA